MILGVAGLVPSQQVGQKGIDKIAKENNIT
jgi:hypothetical protein